jgi:pimeloyl-ACP methyl ester carboxylesterase
MRLIAPVLLVLIAGAAVAQPLGPAEGDPPRQLWLVPAPQPGPPMRTTVIWPRSAGPFPLMVFAHASEQNDIRRADAPPPDEIYDGLPRWFVGRGYAVALPQRPGHGDTGGPYLEDQAGCEDAQYGRSGLMTAATMQSALDFLRGQAFARKDGIVVVGHSAGGWGALALASRNPPHVRAIINFAGGRGGRAQNRPANNCAPDRLVATAAEFGRTAKIPTLWIYSQNDSYFPPLLSGRMFEAFRAAGGRGEYQLVPAFQAEGHDLAADKEGVAVWSPIVAKFLARN